MDQVSEKDEHMTNRNLCSKAHYWPEAIDFDGQGNLYFSDIVAKKLYRFRREEDGSLGKQEQLLLQGFKHAAGISIDRGNELLYLGVTLRGDQVSKVLQIPLGLLNRGQEFEYSYEKLKSSVELSPETLYEYDIGVSKPNGLVFDPQSKNAFYTDENILLGYLLNKPGHVGDTRGLIKQAMLTPNGIDIDPSVEDETVLVVGSPRTNSITRIAIPQVEVGEPKQLLGIGGILGPGPDGLYCMQNGDILAAAFVSGQILYLAWDGSEYRDPIVIADGLDNPTDLVIGPSSLGADHPESLYVTTLVWWRSLIFPAGKVIEIPDVRTRILEKLAA